MSMQNLPVGRRRDDQPDFVASAEIASLAPWDSVLDRLAKLERSHAELARLVNSIHEALPPEIAAATGRLLTLGSPIDPVSAPRGLGASRPPLAGAPPFPPPGLSASPPGYQIVDPWAAPSSEPFQGASESAPKPARLPVSSKLRRLRNRKAAKEAKARIAAAFSAPPPPPGFFASSPIPQGEAQAGESAIASPSPSASRAEVPEHAPSPPPPPRGFSLDFPVQGPVTPTGGFSTASQGSTTPPPPPTGFETSPSSAYSSVVGATELASPTDLQFDNPSNPSRGFGTFGTTMETPAVRTPAEVVPPPPGFATDVPAPPPGFATDVPAPPPGFATDVPAPPPGFATDVPAPAPDLSSTASRGPGGAPPNPLPSEAKSGAEPDGERAMPPLAADFFARSGSRGHR
jgi:hypothetical protein